LKRKAKAGWSLATWRRCTALAFIFLLVAGKHWEGAFAKGSLTAVDWFGALHIVDPLAALENVIATRSFHFEVVLGSVLLILLSALVLGRAFCGWLCPLGLILDLNDWARRRVQRHRNTRLGPRALKYWVLLFVILLAAFAALPVFQMISPINYVVWLAVFACDSGAMSIVLGGLPLLLLMAVDWISPRLWCRSLCPLGAFYSIIGRFGFWRIRIQPTSTSPMLCGLCSRECSMGIKVMELFVHDDHNTVRDPECTRCGDCVDICPQERLCQGISLPV